MIQENGQKRKKGRVGSKTCSAVEISVDSEGAFFSDLTWRSFWVFSYSSSSLNTSRSASSFFLFCGGKKRKKEKKRKRDSRWWMKNQEQQQQQKKKQVPQFFFAKIPWPEKERRFQSCLWGQYEHLYRWGFPWLQTVLISRQYEAGSHYYQLIWG